MVYCIFMASALLLSVERLAYYWISNHSDQWLRVCEKPAIAAIGTPTEVVHRLFYGFKIIQVGVFLGWCVYFGQSALPLPTASLGALVLGGLLVAAGMVLNFSVFQRLGATGVFYGRELGQDVPWVQGFPFSAMRHPQYIGTVLAIWGFFVVMRYPCPDWYVLPLLETAYYIVGAHYEL